MGQQSHEQTSADLEEFADELKPGHVLMHGQYKIISFLNAGGFGITYRAKDSLDRPVVIKECFPGSFCRRKASSVQARSRAYQRELSSVVELFVQEAKSLSRLDHPNIVGVHQVFEENNTAYMALDFVEGQDLLDIIEDPKKSITPAQTEHVLKKILSAVQFIHQKGMLHRDIAPDNILLQKDNEPILIDFGAAREEASKQSRILSEMRVVKDGYSPQEFYITGAEQGNFSDLYALGATFYHLISGKLPENSQARLAAMAANEKDPYEPLKGRFEGYSDRFLEGIDEALSILPKDRFASAQDWTDFLSGEVKTVANNNRTNKTKPLAQGKKGSSKGLLLGGVAAAALVCGLFVYQSISSSGSDQAAGANGAVASENAVATPAVSTTSEEATAATAQSEGANSEGVGTTTDLFRSPVAVSTPRPNRLITPQVESSAAPVAPEVNVTIPQDGTNTELGESGFAPTLVTGDDAIVSNFAVPESAAAATPADVSSDRFVAEAYEVATASQPAETEEGPLDPVEVPTVASTQVPTVANEQAAAADDTVASAVDLSTIRPQARPVTEVAVVNDAQPEVETPAVEVETPVSAVETAVVEAETPVVEEAPNPALAWMNIPSNSQNSAADDEAAPAVAEPEVETPAVDAADTLPKFATVWELRFPEELSSGELKLFAVDGLEVSSISEAQTIVRSSLGSLDLSELTLTLLVGDTFETARLRSYTIPAVQSTYLLNGISFETSFENNAWITRVSNVPSGLRTDLAAGDVVVGDLATAALFLSRTDLPEFLQQKYDEGQQTVTLAIRRDGVLQAADVPNLQ